MMLGYGEWNVNGRSPDQHGDVGRDDALATLLVVVMLRARPARHWLAADEKPSPG